MAAYVVVDMTVYRAACAIRDRAARTRMLLVGGVG